MLTHEEKKRLAEEAEKLAMECLEGRAPHFEPHSYCGCAIGEIMDRALHVRPVRYLGGPAFKLACRLDRLLPDDRLLARGKEGLVSAALRYDESGAALVFPLLALREALLEAP